MACNKKQKSYCSAAKFRAEYPDYKNYHTFFNANPKYRGKRFLISARQIQIYLVMKWGKGKVVKKPKELDKEVRCLDKNQLLVFTNQGHVGIVTKDYSDGIDGFSPRLTWILDN